MEVRRISPAVAKKPGRQKKYPYRQPVGGGAVCERGSCTAVAAGGRGGYELSGTRTSSDVIRFHDLQHTSATLLLLAGENAKMVSERLGHATITITLDTYSHLLPTMQKEAARKLDAPLR